MLRLIREQEQEKIRQAVPGNHPPVEQLERFMRGELPSTEAARVVRHFLKGCSECSQVTRRLWAYGESVPKVEGGPQMAGSSVALAEAKHQVARIISQLESVHWQLVGVAGSLPEAAGEESLETEESSELRRVIECVLTDRIHFALGDLRSVLPSVKAEDQDS